MIKVGDLTGKKFGELTVIEKSFKRGNSTYWKCQCSCGNIKNVAGKHLKSGGTKSCGCKQHGKTHYIHGMTKSKIYKTRAHMLRRCNCPKEKSYQNYGGRGIKVCEEWANSFEAFYKWAMENGYKEGLSIDRIDVNGDYEPSNCRWITMAEQANNTRRTVHITYKNETHTITEWSKITGIPRQLIASRYYRFSNIAEIFEKPLKAVYNQI